VAELLPDGQAVGEHLAGMLTVGHGVDHRTASCARHGDQVPMVAEPGHDAVDIAVEDAADVRRRLPLADLDLAVEERDGVPAEVPHGHLEGNPGAIARSLEDHGQVAAGQGAAGIRARLQRGGHVQDLGDLGCGEIGD
jgi:hypothetical protein